MNTSAIVNIDLGKLGDTIRRYEREWVAVSSENTIVGHGATYHEALTQAKTKGFANVALLKVPPLDYSFAPMM